MIPGALDGILKNMDVKILGLNPEQFQKVAASWNLDRNIGSQRRRHLNNNIYYAPIRDPYESVEEIIEVVTDLRHIRAIKIHGDGIPIRDVRGGLMGACKEGKRSDFLASYLRRFMEGDHPLLFVQFEQEHVERGGNLVNDTVFIHRNGGRPSIIRAEIDPVNLGHYKLKPDQKFPIHPDYRTHVFAARG